MENDAHAREVVRNAEARSEIVLVRIEQAVGIAVLPADENLRRAALECEIRVRISDVMQRPRILVAQAHFDGCGPRDLKAVLHEAVGGPRAELHLRNAGLALLYRRQTHKEAGERRTGAVI